MKIKYHFERMELDGEIVAVPVGDSSEQLHAVLKLNEEAMRIIELLSENTTENEIVIHLLQEYEGDKEQVRQLVHDFLNQLRTEGFLSE